MDGFVALSLVMMLSYPGKPVACTPAPAIPFPRIDKELVKTNFFEYLDFALQFAPAGPEEKDIRARLARIGIGPGKTFRFQDLSLEHKVEVGLGMKEGKRKVEESREPPSILPPGKGTWKPPAVEMVQ